jgi:hypothetical protein
MRPIIVLPCKGALRPRLLAVTLLYLSVIWFLSLIRFFFFIPNQPVIPHQFVIQYQSVTRHQFVIQYQSVIPSLSRDLTPLAADQHFPHCITFKAFF